MRILKVNSAQDLGPLFVDNSHKMIGQDGAFSIPLDKQTLWFFGDTLIGARVPDESLWFPGGQPLPPENMSGKGTIQQMFCNTGLLVPDTGIDGVLNNFEYILDDSGRLKTLLPLLEDEDHDKDRIWCQHGIYLNGKVYLSFIKVRMLPHGFLTNSDAGGDLLPVNFEIVGSGIAVGDPQTWNFKRLLHGDDYIWWRQDVPHFGSNILRVQGEDRLYFYGTLMDTAGVQRCYIARVTVDDIEDYSKYEYLSSPKPEWNSDIRKAISIFADVPSELSISYNQYLGCYLAVHSYQTTDKIVGRTAFNPWGPWSEPIELWTVKVDDSIKLPYNRLIYAGKEHPELAEENGKTIYLTYIEFEEYFPHLIRVTFE
ncbi:MAG: DUF4185 domain-containing protein [Candidatus Marinimicrobia bacterium]|nr:DUF4185 domain-containing protein [Candidatus Neomarinimicrobiota bacterium]